MRPAIDPPLPRAPALDLESPYCADAFVERLRGWLREMEAALQEHEQLRVSAFTGSREVVIDFIGYHNPDLVALQGVDPSTGERATLLLHKEALQLFSTVETLDRGAPRRQIGFQAHE